MKNIFDTFKVGDTHKEEFIDGFKKYPLFNYDAQQYSFGLLSKRNPRKRNIHTGQPKVKGDNGIERVVVIHYKGNFKGWKGSDLFCDYQSCIAISNCGNYAVSIIGNKIKRKYVAPKGMLFKRDNLGIFVERQTDKMDYHLIATDWDIKDFATTIRAYMARAYLTRQNANKLKKANEKNEKLFIKALGNTRVNINDSRAVGNCLEGTLSFCEKYLNLDRKTILDGGHLFSFPATLIIKKAKTEFDKVRAMNACRYAWMRETTLSI